MKAIKRKRIKEAFNTKRDQLQLTTISKAGLFYQWEECRSKDVNRFDVLVNDLQDDDEAVEVFVQMLISPLDYPDVYPFLKHHFDLVDRPSAIAFRNKILDQLIYKGSELNTPFLIEDGYTLENLSYPHVVTKIGLIKKMVEEFDYDFSIHEINQIDSIYIPSERRNDVYSILKLCIPKNMDVVLLNLVDNKFDKDFTLNFSGKSNLICSLFYHLTTGKAINSTHDTTKTFLLSNCLFDGVKRDATIKQVFKEGNEMEHGAITKNGKPKSAKRLTPYDVRKKIEQLAPDSAVIVAALNNLFGAKKVFK